MISFIAFLDIPGRKKWSVKFKKKDRTAPPPTHCLGGRPPKKRCFAFLRGTTLNHGRHSHVMIVVQERGKFFRPHLGRLRNTLHGFAAVHVRLHTSLET